MKWVNYSAATGEIIQVGISPDSVGVEEFSHFTGPIRLNAPNDIDPLRHYYDTSTDLFVERPISPSEFHVWDWPTHSWIQDRALAEKSVRARRATLLTASDWTQLPDVPLETKTAWAAYRQLLRNITDQAGFPFSIIWPTAPQ